MTNDSAGRMPHIRETIGGSIPEDAVDKADVSDPLRQNVSLAEPTAEYGESISAAPSANAASRRITPLSASVFFLRAALFAVFLAAAYFEIMSAVGSFQTA